MKPDPVRTLSREALDFSPGLLSIQELPPAKLPRTVLYSVAVLFFILLFWSIFGRLDVVASAEGRLIPQSYVKIVQPADSGIVREILVHEGQAVDKEQVLMRMDAVVTEADSRAIQSEFQLKGLQLRRIDAELSGQPMEADSSDSQEIFAQVSQQYTAHRHAYYDALEQERAVLSKARHDLQAADETLQKLKKTVPIYQRSAAAYQQLGKNGFYSELAVEEKERERIEKEQELRAQVAIIASLKSSIRASEKKIAQITSTYRSELQDERIEIESQYNKLREEAHKIEHKSDLLALRAPQQGIIKDLATHTVGTVVSPGTVLMVLVPYNEPLQAEVYINNEDVGFVYEGQHVKVKLAAYPFQKYGMIEGRVSHIGADASDFGAGQSNFAKESPSMAEGLKYKGIIALDSRYLENDSDRMQLSPGMQVIADIHLGQRTVMEYLLSPVQKAWKEAGRER